MKHSKMAAFRPVTDCKGQGLAEYLILLMLVAIVSITATKSLGNLIRQKLQQARAEINREVTQYQRSSGESE